MNAARELIETHLRAYGEFLAAQPAGTVDLVHELFVEANMADSVVLARNSGMAWDFHHTGDYCVIVGRRDDLSYGIYLQTPSIPSRNEKAGVWYGSEDRIDEDGRRWTRSVRAVCDDFGDLVEVST